MKAAKLRVVSVASISELIQRGRLRSVQMFGKVLVYRSEVLAFEREKPGPKKKSGSGLMRRDDKAQSAADGRGATRIRPGLRAALIRVHPRLISPA